MRLKLIASSIQNTESKNNVSEKDPWTCQTMHVGKSFLRKWQETEACPATWSDTARRTRRILKQGFMFRWSIAENQIFFPIINWNNFQYFFSPPSSYKKRLSSYAYSATLNTESIWNCKKNLIGPLLGEVWLFRVVLRLRGGTKSFFKPGQFFKKSFIFANNSFSEIRSIKSNRDGFICVDLRL